MHAGKFSVQTREGAHQIGVNAVSWAPSLAPGSLASTSPPTSFQRRFVSAGCDNQVKVWTVDAAANAESWRPEILEGDAKHNDWVRDVAWAPAAGLLVSLYNPHPHPSLLPLTPHFLIFSFSHFSLSELPHVPRTATSSFGLTARMKQGTGSGRQCF